MASSDFISLRDWPLVVVTATERIDDQQFDAYVHTMEEIRRRREPWAYILDARIACPMSTRQRRRYAASAERDAGLMAAYLRCAAFVVPHAVHRGYLKAIHWMAPPPYPSFVTPALSSARAFVDQTWPQWRAAHGLRQVVG